MALRSSSSENGNGLIINGPRTTKGCIPAQSSLYDSPADIKRAKGLRWVFYKKYDPCPFDIGFNDPIWPRGVSLIEKLTMEKNFKLNFKSSDSGKFRASFVERVPCAEIEEFMKAITRKVARADKSLSDISSIGDASFCAENVNPSEVAPSTQDQNKNKENGGPSTQPPKTKKAKTTNVQRKVFFQEDLRPVEGEESPHVDLVQSSSSTPQQPLAATNPTTDFHNLSDFMDLVTSKMNEVMDAQESHAKKVMKDNAVFRRKLLEAVSDGENVQSVKKMKQAIKAKRAEGEPLIFDGRDLMKIKPQSDEPRLFGRLIAPVIFGEEKDCKLMSQRLGVKINRKNCRDACEKELEELFVECVGRNFSDNRDDAVERAITGANQYGVDMKQKYCDGE